MSDERRVAPNDPAPDAAPTVPNLRSTSSSKPDAPAASPASADAGSRRRGRLGLRIPDDEVARPRFAEAEGGKVPDGVRSEKEPPAPSSDARASVRPMRIITINPPPPPEGVEIAIEVPLSDDEQLEEDPPTPLTRRVSRTGSSAPPAQRAPSIPDEPRAAASAPPVVRASAPPAPVARPLLSPVPAPRSVSVAPAPAPAPVATAPAPATAGARPQAISVPAVQEATLALAPPVALEVPDRPSPDSDHEILAEDLVSVDATPSPSAVELAGEPAMRSRLPSNLSVPPAGGKVPSPPTPQSSKPPLVIVPPRMGSVAPQVPEGPGARRKGRFWWEDLFNDDYLRASERLTEEQLAREVDFIEESLGIERGGAVLDLGCGTGRHAVELARRGYQVVGFDLSLAMLARAGDEAQDRNAKLNFVQGDMREMTFSEQFDGILCWNTSFGYFEEEKNALVIGRIRNALKGGGLLLLDVVNRDFLIRQSPSLAWFEADGCVCMDEMIVDFITSRMRVKRTMMLDDGRTREIEYTMRVYSLHELGKMLHEQGFKVCEVSGRIATPGVFFGHESPRTIILAEKR